jgi:hypothetical protein
MDKWMNIAYRMTSRSWPAEGRYLKFALLVSTVAAWLRSG